MAGYRRTDICEPAVWSRTMLGDPGPATTPSLRNGCEPWTWAVHEAPWPATRTHRLCRRLIPRCAGHRPYAGAAEYRGVAGMAGLGAAAFVAEVNTIVPASQAGTGLQSPLGPGRLMGLSGRTQSAAGVNHVSACGFTSGLPVAVVAQCLHRAVTSERAIRAGPIADMPCICNNGRGGAPDGAVGAIPAGGCHGRESGASAWLGPFPVWSCCGLPQLFSCSAAWKLAAAWVSGLDDLLRRGPGSVVPRHSWPSAGNRVNVVRFPSGAFTRGFSTSACTWARSFVNGPGVSPCGSGA